MSHFYNPFITPKLKSNKGLHGVINNELKSKNSTFQKTHWGTNWEQKNFTKKCCSQIEKNLGAFWEQGFLEIIENAIFCILGTFGTTIYCGC